MFLLISFVLANNYCVEKTPGRCQNLCQNLPETFTQNYTFIPNDSALPTDNGTKHNIYIADQVDYNESSHNLIFCDTSIHLTYSRPFKNIILKDHVYVDSNTMLRDVPILFNFSTDIKIEIYTSESRNFSSIILESTEDNHTLVPVFFTDNFPENLISISSNTGTINIPDITENVNKLFSATDRFQQINRQYYCISDKEDESEKCADYSSHNLKHIRSTTQITHESCFLIFDTSIPQILVSNVDNLNENYHIVVLENSDVTYYPNLQSSDDDFYVILNSDKIEMPNLLFEGKGKLTLSNSGHLNLLPKTETNNHEFTIKTRTPFSLEQSYIHAIDEKVNYNFDKKIQISEICHLVGPSCLAGLFESERYQVVNDLNSDVTVETLKEYPYDYVTYYFGKGDHLIPASWKKACRFQGTEPSETHFIFSDVHYYDGLKIDNFIDVNTKPSKSFNKITIKPSSYFYLDSFGKENDQESNEEYTIHVENDFFMDGDFISENYDNFSTSQCKIIGQGTIKFVDENFHDAISKLCTKADTVNFNVSNNLANYAVCIGQENLSTCKSKINNVDSITDTEWLWFRNIKTISKIKHQWPIYLTNEQTCDIEDAKYDITLAPSADLTLKHNPSSSIEVFSNGTSHIQAQSNLTKLSCIFYNNLATINYDQVPFHIDYNEAPTDIDYQIYLYYDNVKLYMKYLKDFDEKSLILNGKSVIHYRLINASQIQIFKIPETIKFMANENNSYTQICFADEPVESNDLYDFVFTSDINVFISLNRRDTESYIYKDIILNLTSNPPLSSKFVIVPDIEVTLDLPNNTQIMFTSNAINILMDFDVYYNFYVEAENTYFIFDVKDVVLLNAKSSDQPTIYPDFTITSSKESVEIIPSRSLFNEGHYFTVPENILICSPIPDYIGEKIRDEHIVNYSSNWEYYYVSESKPENIDEPYKYITAEEFENDENLPENIVVYVADNYDLSIPSNWTSSHNVLIVNGFSLDNSNLKDVSNITYQRNCLMLNNRFKVIVGIIHIFIKEEVTINIDRLKSSNFDNFMYQARLDCYYNEKTRLILGEIYQEYYNSTLVDVIGGDNNFLEIIASTDDDLYYFLPLFKFNIPSNLETQVNYECICYNSNDDSSQCPRKHAFASTFDSIITILEKQQEVPIIVTSNIDIPYTTGKRFILNPINNEIEINLPYSPNSMSITEDEEIHFPYSDSTVVDILNSSIINVKLNKSLELDIKSDTDSAITFDLGSDIIVSTKEKITADIIISVINNSHHLYTEDEISDFGNIFQGMLELYQKVCAYTGDPSFCLSKKHESFEDVFNPSKEFPYDEVEVSISETQIISLPHVEHNVIVSLMDLGEIYIIVKNVTQIQIKSDDSIIVNDYWYFKGDLSKYRFELSDISSLSVTCQLSSQITLQLTNVTSVINLLNFYNQSHPNFNFLKYGEDQNLLMLNGNEENCNNLMSSVNSNEGILFITEKTIRYLCLCNDEDSCTKCKEGISGMISFANSISSDPGNYTNIRIYMNVELSMDIFTIDHEAFIGSEYHVSLTNISTIYQNVTNGLKIEKLIFPNGTNLLLKPRENDLNIYMNRNVSGPSFTVDMDQNLRLKVPNIGEENVKASPIYVKGDGELNAYDYPFEQIHYDENIRIIRGIYAICNASDEELCAYDPYYKILDCYNNFDNEFANFTRIVILLNTFDGIFDARINHLRHHSIMFANPESRSLLENQAKVRFLSISELVIKSDSSIDISNSLGSSQLNFSDTDFFIIGFDDMLTIKQEGSFHGNQNKIVIQPMKNNVTINIDESVDLLRQKMIIETESNQQVSISIISNNPYYVEDDFINMFEYDPEKVSFGEVVDRKKPTKKPPTSKSGNTRLSKGMIIGICVVGALLVIVGVIGIVFSICQCKEKNKIENSIDDFSDE